MSIYASLPHVPYFYIIQHITSGMLYAGCRFSKQKNKFSINGCNPTEFMKEGGYCTSSKEVKNLIKQDGLSSFKTKIIIDEKSCLMSVYDYETVFLQTWDICNNKMWLNRHNNTSQHNPTRKSIKVYNDGTKNYDYAIGEIVPENLVLGMVKGSHSKGGNNRKGRVWVHNGEKQKLLKLDEIKQDGWDFGQLPISYSERKTTEGYVWHNDGEKKFLLSPEDAKTTNLTIGLKELTGSNKGFITYNDGVRQYSRHPSFIPESNWVIGSLISPGKDKIWYNDGNVNKRIPSGEIVPLGFTKGFIAPNRKPQK